MVDVDERPDEGTGFVFDDISARSLLGACRRAVERRRRDGDEWRALIDRGMAIDWAWEAGPAAQYEAMYRRAMALRRDR